MPVISLFNEVQIHFAKGQIIEKEERACTLNNNVIDAHGDEINANRIMPIRPKRYFQLGADTIRSGYQDRVLQFRTIERIKPAKAANIGDDTPRKVLRTSGLIRFTSSLALSRSTPASRYRFASMDA